MARKEEAPNMVERFAEFKELKNIDKTTMISVLEESFRNVLAKMFGTDENLDVIMNPDKGDVQIFQNLEVVPDGEVTNPNLQISLSDARADEDPDVEIGEEHTKEISVDVPSSTFARPSSQRSSISRRKPSMPNSKSSRDSLSPAKSIRPGAARLSCSTRRKTSSYSPATNPSRATISARATSCWL